MKLVYVVSDKWAFILGLALSAPLLYNKTKKQNQFINQFYLKIKWARQDSNLRPIGYEPTALPLSYEPMERETRLELATTCLEGRDSTN